MLPSSHASAPSPSAPAPAVNAAAARAPIVPVDDADFWTKVFAVEGEGETNAETAANSNAATDASLALAPVKASLAL